MEIEMDHVANLRSFANLYIAESKAQLLAAADELESLKSKLDASEQRNTILEVENEKLNERLAGARQGRDDALSRLGTTSARLAEVEAELYKYVDRLSTATRLLGFAVKEWAGWLDDARGVQPTEPEYAEAQAFLLRNEPVVEKPCTCHPDDNPPRPCPRKYALTECRKAAACE